MTGLALASITASCFLACGSSDDSKDGGTGGGAALGGAPTGGTASTGSTPGTGGAATTGGTTPAGGAGTGGGETGGAGTGGTTTGACATKTTAAAAAIADFDSWDGVTDPAEYSAPAIGVETFYVGPYAYGDGDDSFTLSLGEGNASDYALGIADTEAVDWGAGMGLWLTGCVDASAYSGITFWVRGNAPQGTAGITISTEDTTSADGEVPGGTCAATPCTPPGANFAVTDTWTQVTLAWGDFTDGVSGTATLPFAGDEITAFSFNVALVYEDDGTGNWVPVRGPLDLQLDGIAFY